MNFGLVTFGPVNFGEVTDGQTDRNRWAQKSRIFNTLAEIKC